MFRLIHFSHLRYLKFLLQTKSSISIHKASLIQKVASRMQKRIRCAMHFEFLITKNRERLWETYNLSKRRNARAFFPKDVLSKLKYSSNIIARDFR